MKIIPAIDLIEGKCVRLTKGDYSTKKVYNENPLEVAKSFEANGIQYLHLVDLDGAKNKRITNYKILAQLASNTGLQIDFGGGLQSNEDLKIAFECGAAQITAGSVVINEPQLFLSWIEIYGNERIILGADFKNGQIATHGWMETSDIDPLKFIGNQMKNGIKYVICTDVSKDGMLNGPATDFYETICQSLRVNLIASGGITSLAHLCALEQVPCYGAIIGKALYEGRISLKELQNYMVSKC